MTQDVKRFILKTGILLSPAIVLLCLYLILDPFEVLYTYDNYYASRTSAGVSLNNDYIATELLKRQSPSNRYDSYIFGSSRSRFYQVSDWKKHIRSARCFHYESSAESLYGIHAKLKYLDRNCGMISNAIFVMDIELLSDIQNSNSHFARKHPDLSGESSFKFQLRFLKTFLRPMFFGNYLYFVVTGNFHSYMKDLGVLDNTPFEYELFSNEIRYSQFENLLATNPAAYYSKRLSSFYNRPKVPECALPVIGPGQMEMLTEMSGILTKHRTDFKLVISPLYNQKKLNHKDLRDLQTLFGKNNVYDFSGVNEITQSYTNYYETSHYRPHVAREIMSRIYSNRN
jgi:hypothetical protein